MSPNPQHGTPAGDATIAIRQLARQTGADVQDLQTLYVLEALLARIAVSDHRDDFVLKGGVLLAAFAARRPTKDIDLQATGLADDAGEVAARVADVIIAETGADMTVFETPGHLASWAGACPSSNESAGRRKSSHILPGNKCLKSALGVAALSASRSKNTYLAVKYRRIAARRGPMKAIVALEHSTLNAAWHMLATGECYNDPGADHSTRLDPIKSRDNAIKKLTNLGYTVTITPATAARLTSLSY